MIAAGSCWIVFALVLGLFVFRYLSGGAGLQVFGFFFSVSSATVLMALVHLVGFIAAACLCFAIGVGLCVHGLVPAPEPENRIARGPRERFEFLRHFPASAHAHEKADSTLCCVCCGVPLPAPVHLCPECGWTQPDDHRAPGNC